MSHFFVYNQIPEDQKINNAVFYMTGPTLQWFHCLHSTEQLTSWGNFIKHIKNHFDLSAFINHESQLFKLKQSSMMESYLSEFECLLTSTTGLSSSSLLNCFLSNLRVNLQREMYVLKPKFNISQPLPSVQKLPLAMPTTSLQEYHFSVENPTN